MTSAAVDITLRVGASGPAVPPGPHADVPRSGALPFTGASLVAVLAVAIFLVLLGVALLLPTRGDVS